MIIAKLKGGLGNQLFQYAAARNLSMLRNSTLLLDISAYQKDKLRSYDLWAYNIQEIFATEEQINYARYRVKRKLPAFLKRWIQKAVPYRYTAFLEWTAGPYNPKMADVSFPVYLEGYWQSEKYFKPIENIIRQEFTLRQESLSQSVMSYAEQVKTGPSVSLHIRRGDYVSNQKFTLFHGLCTLEYYAEAVRFIESKIENPRFHIFSDDIEWAKNNLTIQHPTTFIEPNEERTAQEDLWLMSQCQHHIIANSSFSWWGAWLCMNPEKIVCAPRKWFNNDTVDTRDILPASWNKL